MTSDKITKRGEIPKASVLVSIIRKEAKYAHKTFAYRLALKLAGKVRSSIYQQTLDLEPLSERYLARKIRRGLDPRILIATGRYVNNIRVRKDGDSYVVSPGEGFTENGVSLTTLGSWLEFGTRNEDGSQKMPPRPHWRSIWWEFKREKITFENEVLKAVSPRIRKEIKQVISSLRNRR